VPRNLSSIERDDSFTVSVFKNHKVHVMYTDFYSCKEINVRKR